MDFADLRTPMGDAEQLSSPSQATFELYLDDDRYAVPTFKLIEAADEAAAVALAHRLLRESPHHRGAELCRDGARLAVLGSYAE
jgi:hypothetical protein